MKLVEKVTKSEKETFKFAVKFAKMLNKGDIVLLSGDLGAGKTVFSKGITKGRRVKADVVSPTFTIMNDYGGKVYHYDLYRLTGQKEFEATGAYEMMFDGRAISVVEWPEKVGYNYFPASAYRVIIEKLNEQERRIVVKNNEGGQV